MRRTVPSVPFYRKEIATVPHPPRTAAKLPGSTRSAQFWFTVQVITALLTFAVVLAAFIVCGSASTVDPMAVGIPVAWGGLGLVIWAGVKRARAVDVERLAAPSNGGGLQGTAPAATAPGP